MCGQQVTEKPTGKPKRSLFADNVVGLSEPDLVAVVEGAHVLVDVGG